MVHICYTNALPTELPFMITVDCDHGRSLTFDPQQAAILMIDMQRDFINEHGVAGLSGEDVAPMQAIVPSCCAALDASRQAGLSIYHTREGHLPDLTDLHQVKHQRSAEAGGEIGKPGPLGRFLIRGEHGHDFVDELKPNQGEPVIDKPGFGAFYRTDLEQQLQDRGITHLVIAGVTTQCCVFSTLREAVDRGFFCTTLKDCTAAYDTELHQATLAMIASECHLFGWISDSKRLIAALNK